MWEQQLDELETVPPAEEVDQEWDDYVVSVQAALEAWWESAATAAVVEELCELP